MMDEPIPGYESWVSLPVRGLLECDNELVRNVGEIISNNNYPILAKLMVTSSISESVQTPENDIEIMFQIVNLLVDNQKEIQFINIDSSVSLPILTLEDLELITPIVFDECLIGLALLGTLCGTSRRCVAYFMGNSWQLFFTKD